MLFVADRSQIYSFHSYSYNISTGLYSDSLFYRPKSVCKVTCNQSGGLRRRFWRRKRIQNIERAIESSYNFYSHSKITNVHIFTEFIAQFQYGPASQKTFRTPKCNFHHNILCVRNKPDKSTEITQMK